MKQTAKSRSQTIRTALVKQVVRAISLNQKKGRAHTKNRSQVRGGGRKPFKQKGTGRARAGSIRSPLWRGGGVVFGPTKEKSPNKQVTKKMRKQSLVEMFKIKEEMGQLIKVPSLKLPDYKTKTAIKFLANLPLEKVTNVVFITDEMNPNFVLATANLPNISVKNVSELNCLDLYNYKQVVIEVSAYQKVMSRLKKAKEKHDN